MRNGNSWGFDLLLAAVIAIINVTEMKDSLEGF